MISSGDQTSSPVGRLLRYDGERWAPVGEPLPPFDHAPPSPMVDVAPWVLPCDLGTRAHDVVVVAEVAHQLLARCERDDPVYAQLAQQSMVLHPYEEVMAWLAQIEVWIGRRLAEDRPWPLPPEPSVEREG